MNGLQQVQTSTDSDLPNILVTSEYGKKFLEYESVDTKAEVTSLQPPTITFNTTGFRSRKILEPTPFSFAHEFDEDTADFLQEFRSESGEVDNYVEVLTFIQKNENLITEIKNAIRLIETELANHNNNFNLRLDLHNDPEIKNLRTLFLLIVGDFQPKEAFKILESLDKKLAGKVEDITKFNVNVEFTD